jgi:hypothetical protein
MGEGLRLMRQLTNGKFGSAKMLPGSDCFGSSETRTLQPELCRAYVSPSEEKLKGEIKKERSILQNPSRNCGNSFRPVRPAAK